MDNRKVEKIEKISNNKKDIDELAIKRISKDDNSIDYAAVQKEENEKLKNKLEREKKLNEKAKKHNKTPEELFRSMYQVSQASYRARINIKDIGNSDNNKENESKKDVNKNNVNER